MCLPIPIEAYRRESVAGGGPDWVQKFNRFIVENPPLILSDSDELPASAAGIKENSVFQRGNIWNMQDALLRPNADVTLVDIVEPEGWRGSRRHRRHGQASKFARRKGTGAEQRRAVRHRIVMTALLASVTQNTVELVRELAGRQPIIIDSATL